MSKKVILINCIVFFVLFCVLEFVSYLYLRADAKDFMDKFNKAAKAEKRFPMTQKYAPVKVAEQKDFDEWRKINIGDKNKPSVLFFGCSYMYGSLLPEEETLSYLVYKKSGRTTVNRAVPGGCIMNMFYDLKDNEFIEKIKKELPEPDYIVYLWINDHFNRICNVYRSSVRPADLPYYLINTKWVEENGELKNIYPPKWTLPFYGLYCVKAYHFFYAQKFEWEKKKEKMLRYFLMAKNYCGKVFPNAKFVIIEYKDSGHRIMTDDLRQSLKNEGIIVLNAEELAGHELETDEWRASDKEHPNGKAFNDVANGLIRALNL